MAIAPREVALRAIRLQETPRQPVALLSGGIWTLHRHGLSLEEALVAGAERSAAVISETSDLLRSDIVWTGSGYHNLAIRALGGKITFRPKGAPDVNGILLPEASVIDGLDLDRLEEDPGIQVLRETTRLVSKAIGHRYLVGSSAWGPFTYAGSLFGVERLMRSICRDQAAARAVLDFAAELSYRYLEPFVGAGAELVSIADPTASGDMISRKHFEAFVLPYQKKVIQRLKAKGAEVLVHICGNTLDRLDLLAESGAGVISVDYKVDLAQAAPLLAGKAALAGNLNPVDIMQNSNPEGVAVAGRACIGQARAASHILMPGCDIPPTVPLENIQALVETAHRDQ